MTGPVLTWSRDSSGVVHRVARPLTRNTQFGNQVNMSRSAGARAAKAFLAGHSRVVLPNVSKVTVHTVRRGQGFAGLRYFLAEHTTSLQHYNEGLYVERVGACGEGRASMVRIR